MRSTGETGTTWTEEGMGRREKKDKSWERWTSRQIDRGRLTGPLPTPTKHPRPGLWLLDSHLLEGAEVSPCLRMGAAGHISRPPRGWPSCRQRGSPIPSPLLQAWGPLFWEEPQKPGASQGDVGPRGPGCRGPGGGGKAVGTHRSAGAPGARPSAASPSSAAQAGAGCAAAATADDLQLPLGAVSPLKELLDELLQPQLGTGLPRCRLLQELVNLHHLPGPGAVSYPSASVRLPTHPPEEPLSGRERRGHSWPWCPLAVTWVDEEPSWEHCPTRWHTQKGKHTLRVIPPPPTKPAPDTPDTLAPQRNTRRPSQSHTATSSLQKHSWAHTYRPHSPVTSPTHSYTRIYVMFIHRHTFTVLRLCRALPTHSHTHSETFLDAEKHTYSCTNLQGFRVHTAHLKVM